MRYMQKRKGVSLVGVAMILLSLLIAAAALLYLTRQLGGVT